MNREKLVELLSEMGTFLDLLGENPFKVRAHLNGARVLETFDGDLDEKVKSGTLIEIKGIGAGLASKIEEFHKTGKIAEHDKLAKKIKPGLLEILKVPGLGPKKVRALHEELSISTLGELEYACRENRLLKIDGFGEKTQEKILKGIEFLKKYQTKFLFSDAWLEAQVVLGSLRRVKGVLQTEVAGSLRRRKEIVGDIDILVAVAGGGKVKLDAAAAARVMKAFVEHPSVENITGNGETKSSVVFKNGMACDLRVVSEAQYPFALMYFTGSKEHNTELRRIAKAKGYRLNEYGLMKSAGEISEGDSAAQGVKAPDPSSLKSDVPARSEADIFKFLGLAYVEPEMRENMGEIEAARAGDLPHLVVRENIKGVFHCHTTDSDGVNSLEEMVGAAQKLGFEYIGISDHSATAAGYANGLKSARVLEQFKSIEALQKKFKIKIFKGIESDILSDGSLDYEDKLLAKFDFVIGSIHQGFSTDEAAMTKRVLNCFKSPYMDILGHPTGRLLLARDSFAIDMRRVIAAAADAGVVVELNANPQRLDVDWRLGKVLRDSKAKVSINPDAHSIAGLEDVEFGVGIARKAWVEPEMVLNVLPANKVLKTLRRGRAGL